MVMTRFRGAAVLAAHSLVVLGLMGCAGPGESVPTSIPEAPAPAPASSPATRPRIVVLGDSLAAGLGVSREDAFPARLEAKLRAAGYPHEVVNAGVSGDTTAGGLRRLDWALEGDVRLLIVALGGNDGLRGLPVREMKQNLEQIVETAQVRGIDVLLTGMEAPPNFGPKYTVEFREAFRVVAAEHHIALVPFLLEGVAGVPELNQRDGIHPNPDGASAIADLLWLPLEKMLARAPSS
jgi:acyl-CoA thioesterase-1